MPRGFFHYIFKTLENEATSNTVRVVEKKQLEKNRRLLIVGNDFTRVVLNIVGGEYDCMLGFGGDYDTYYSALNNFFLLLQECQVEPVVVFYGPHPNPSPPSQRKLDKVIGFIESGFADTYRERSLLLFSKQTLVRCLNARNIKHLTLNHHEKGQIVALANRWRCPIMTSDSYYFLQQYEAGVYVIRMLMWDYMNDWQVRGDVGARYIETLAYETRRLLAYHGLQGQNPRWVALLAACARQLPQQENDNDDNDMADGFLQNNLRDQQFRDLFESIRQLITETITVDAALNQADVLFFGGPDGQLLQRIQNQFLLHTPQVARQEYYQGLDQGVHSSSIITRGGRSLPQWFAERFRTSEINSELIDVLTTRSCSIWFQLEDMDSPNDSRLCGLQLRKILWGILLEYDDDVNGTVSSYCREFTHIVEAVESPVLSVGGMDVPSLDEIPEMTSEDRVVSLLSWVGVERERLEPLPPSAWFLILVTRYWVRNRENIPNEPPNPYVKALILCYIRLGLNPDDWQNVNNVDIIQAKARLSNPNQSFGIPPINLPMHERIRVHHNFSVWKIIFLEVEKLNEILMKPVKDLGACQCFKGTFLYNLHWFGTNNANPETALANVMGASVYNNIYLPLLYAITL